MATLSESFSDQAVHTQLVRDCCDVVEAEVADKRGISGLAIKAGFKAVKGIRPNFVRSVVEDLIPEFAEVLDPIYQEAKASDQPVAEHFVRNGPRAADALLSITDGKAERSEHKLIRATYKKLRGAAKKNVVDAMPRVGKLIEKYGS